MDADDPKEVANDLVEQLVASKVTDELQGVANVLLMSC
jgi:hypothetical protein